MSKLRKMREKAGLTMEVLAVKAGLTRQTVENLELEKTNPNLLTLKMLARVLNCRVRDLYDE